MRLPFTVEQFLGVFENYNLPLWFMHVVVYILGILAIVLAIKRTAFSNRTISAVIVVEFKTIFNSKKTH